MLSAFGCSQYELAENRRNTSPHLFDSLEFSSVNSLFLDDQLINEAKDVNRYWKEKSRIRCSLFVAYARREGTKLRLFFAVAELLDRGVGDGFVSTRKEMLSSSENKFRYYCRSPASCRSTIRKVCSVSALLGKERLWCGKPKGLKSGLLQPW